MTESPLEFYQRTAAGFGIKEADLRERIMLTSIREGGEIIRGRTTISLYHAPHTFYYSHPRKGLVLLASSRLRLDTHAPLSLEGLQSMSVLLKEEFIFALQGAGEYAKIVVLDTQILASECHPKGLTKTLFEKGRDYTGALTEMLSAYAGKLPLQEGTES